MKFYTRLICWLLVSFLAAGTQAEISKELSSVPIRLLDGRVVKLSDYKGKKPVYLKFWASWCQPCMKEMPHFEEIQKKYGDSVVVIGVNIGINDTVDDVTEVIKKFGLTMPTAFDSNGKLAQDFKFVGTPYHVLFDRNMNLVHRGHEANVSLDNKLSLLSGGKTAESILSDVFQENAPQLVIPNIKKRPTAIFFTATWCDWYLQDARPKASQNCSTSQVEFNKLVEFYPAINWVLVVSGLWTADSDLLAYEKKYQIPLHGLIDQSNKAFVKFKVNTFPTLVIVENDMEIYRASYLVDDEKLKGILGRISKAPQ